MSQSQLNSIAKCIDLKVFLCTCCVVAVMAVMPALCVARKVSSTLKCTPNASCVTLPSLQMKESKEVRHSEEEDVIVCVADTTSFRILSAVAEVSVTVAQAFFKATSTSFTKVDTCKEKKS